MKANLGKGLLSVLLNHPRPSKPCLAGAPAGKGWLFILRAKKHTALWKDIRDVLRSRSRRREKRIPLEKVKAGLIASGKLHA